MFEEICLVCGKQLVDDALAYCSENCQSLDISSPSVSSASSAVSSPNLGYATGGDVPALIPSALGSALTKYTRPRHHYSVSSSSASSTSWSAVTDDEDDVYLGISSYRSNHFADSSDSFYEGSSKSANFLDSINPSALSYARRPSGTNNRATVSNPYNRASSYNVHDIPRSAPLHSHLSSTDDDSDLGFSSRDDAESESPKPVSSPPKKRNRASLPACFSLLQMSLAEGKHISPVSSSSNTITRPSPPTPKLPAAGLTHTSSIASIHTPRGRRRAPGNSRSSRGDSSSRSHSRSRSRRVALPQFSPRPHRRQDPADWTSAAGLPAAGRRDSSPPPAMRLSIEALEDHNRLLSAAATRAEAAPGFRKGRGRTRGDVDVDAPGFGHGRSGLLDRERALGLGNRPSRVQ